MFTAYDILNEFVECSRVVGDASALAEAYLFSHIERNRLRVAEWYKFPPNRTKKLAYMRAYNSDAVVKQRSYERNRTEHTRALKRASDRKRAAHRAAVRKAASERGSHGL